MSYAIDVSGLRVARGGREVLHSLTFAVPAGAITGLLGPSGSGKTTLLRAIVGLQAGVDGRLEVLGRQAGSAELRRDIGYVGQTPAVYADLSVRRNLEYFAAVLDVPATAVDRVLDEVALTDAAEQQVGTLSGGQRARTSLAVALLDAPRLLVLDEPTVGLDPVLRRDLWALFRRLTGAGRTLVVSSHVMDEAQRCDRLLLLRDGRLVADDTLAGVLEQTSAADVEAAFLTLAEQVPA